ncbi:GNAT family N-acetyltransferase [Litorilinea aerophila]|uniref:GNAT family N-acetyltransferase n=1 Tax=Litorilinea aerophila TaxID=1204385 RepID=UPI001B87C1DE|nr:GNAT family protein [Litorilinea aerophila]MCC9074654.1 GNAT family N-acetyltransferase [Litorilinea aerophila]
MQTRRLTFRHLEAADLNDLFALYRDYAFGRLGLTRLVCLIDEQNQASIRVAEKIGMAFEKNGEDDVGPFQLYAMAAPNQAESRGDDCPEEPNP